jgi:hypothetical protein
MAIQVAPQVMLSHLSRNQLKFRIRLLLLAFMASLVVSGATAIPLAWELKLLVHYLPAPAGPGAWASTHSWLVRVRDALIETDLRYPFLAYGTDWLAFGHFGIAIAFYGPLRDPVRNVWVIQFGMIVSALIIPYAFLFGQLREIPVYWRLIDCAFGVFALPLLWVARHYTIQLEKLPG